MDKDKKNRSGSMSNEENKQDQKVSKGKSAQPGGPEKSNRQTGGSKRRERDDSNGGAETNTTKKQQNSI